MYNLTADRAETTDLWATQREDAKAMLGRFIAWQASVDHSKGADEIGKRPHDSRSGALRSSEVSKSERESCRQAATSRPTRRPPLLAKDNNEVASRIYCFFQPLYSALPSRAPPCFAEWRTAPGPLGLDTGVD